MDFQRSGFEWVELKSVLSKWDIDKDQFVDACMLAGTEYCLTFPYLGQYGSQVQATSQSKFNFVAAIKIVKEAPLINWMQQFPNEEMKNDHVSGYCVCRVLVQSSPVLHTDTSDVRALGDTTFQNTQNRQNAMVPKDFSEIAGERLPNSLYYLMVQGVISHKIPQAFARGEWVDKSQPLVDTTEFRNLLTELIEYREKAFNLIVRHLHGSFAQKPIICKAFWEQLPGKHGQAFHTPPPKQIQPDPTAAQGLAWRITAEGVQAELERQKADKVDLKFCLQWHANEFHTDGPLYQSVNKGGVPQVGEATFTKDKESLSALVHFMLLEHLELIADDGGMTVIGNALASSPRHLMEPCLVALECMKFGVLNGEPFEPAQPDKTFPEALQYPSSKTVSPLQKSVFLLTRVMSLVPMRLKVDMWNADVTFDLAAFHCMLRLLKRSLRQLTEASLASVLMKDLSQVKLLPPAFLCASPTSKDHLQTHALLPTFMLSRASMGIVANFFLTYSGPKQNFATELHSKFPCCEHPMEDLRQAFLFYEDLGRCVAEMCEAGLDCGELMEDMKVAGDLLHTKQNELGLFPVASNLRGDESDRVKAAVRSS